MDTTKIEKEYNKLLESGDNGKVKLNDDQVEDIVETLGKAVDKDPMLKMIHNLPSNGGDGNHESLDTTTEEVTVRINPDTGERLIVGTPKDKTEKEQEFITDTFEQLWEQAENSDTTDLNKLPLSDTAILDKAKEQFSLSPMELTSFLNIVKEYREKNGEITNLYAKLPAAIKKMVDTGAIESGATNNISPKQLLGAKNNISKIILDSFISDITMNQAVIDFNTEMNKVLSDANATARDLYYESVEDRLHQIDLVIDNVNKNDESIEEKREKVTKLFKLRDAMNDAIDLEKFRDALKRIKIKKIDLEKPRRVMSGFDNKYVSSAYSIHSITVAYQVLNREFSKEYDEETIARFILAFCKYTMNMHPENIFEHTFMYYFVSNIIYLKTTDSDKSELENKIVENIKKCLDELCAK